MRSVVFVVASLLTLWTGVTYGAVVSKETAEHVRVSSEKAARTATGKAAEYAKEMLESAQASISAAQIAVSAGNEKEALQKVELADLQLNVAEAKAAEKEMLEQVAVRRTELKKLEAQLERYRQGEEN